MIIVGINAYYADSSSAVFVDVVLVAAIVLLILSLLDIVPPWKEFQDALPIIYAPVQNVSETMRSS